MQPRVREGSLWCAKDTLPAPHHLTSLLVHLPCQLDPSPALPPWGEVPGDVFHTMVG